MEYIKDIILKQINFIAETDKLKGVLRKTSPINLDRKENSAEHSWQVILSAIIFAEHSNNKIDLLKVIKMLTIHDIVEIDVGDVLHYEKNNVKNLFEKELMAAKRIFGILDLQQENELINLWIEFEKRETLEAKYATAIDRLMGIIINSNSKGGNWYDNNITLKKIIDKNSHIMDGSKDIWDVVLAILNECVEKGYLEYE